MHNSRRLVVSFWSISALCTRPFPTIPAQAVFTASLDKRLWKSRYQPPRLASTYTHTHTFPSPDRDSTPQAVSPPPPPPFPTSPAFLILTCFSLLLKLEVKESTDGSAASWKASSTPPDSPLSSLWNSLSSSYNFCSHTKPHSHNVLSPRIPFPSARHHYLWFFFLYSHLVTKVTHVHCVLMFHL